MNLDVIDLTTDENIDAALEAAQHLPPEPIAVSAEWNRALDVIIIRLDTGRRLVIPREDMQGLRDATPEQIAGDSDLFRRRHLLAGAGSRP